MALGKPNSVTPVASTRKHTPVKAETALLVPFAGLPLSAVVVPSTRKECEAALADLKGCQAVGFDTESKPTFRVGQVSDGPHVVQFSTPERAYIFQLRNKECLPTVAEILEAENVVKVGFGLKSDRCQLHKKLGVEIRAVLDLDKVFRADGYRSFTGVRSAIAIMFNQKFQKPKSVTTSNWALPRLKENQLLYAANDAYAAIRVLMALNRPLHDLPIACLPSLAEPSSGMA